MRFFARRPTRRALPHVVAKANGISYVNLVKERGGALVVVADADSLGPEGPRLDAQAGAEARPQRALASGAKVRLGEIDFGQRRKTGGRG